MSDTINAQVSRRSFLKKIGAGAAAMVATQIALGQIASHASEKKPLEDTWGVLIDLTRCTGCNSCALACKSANNLPYVNITPQNLSSTAYTFVDSYSVSSDNNDTESRHVKRQCMHCLNPACVSACPAGAMHQSEEGPVIYQAEHCLGCRYCQRPSVGRQPFSALGTRS